MVICGVILLNWPHLMLIKPEHNLDTRGKPQLKAINIDGILPMKLSMVISK